MFGRFRSLFVLRVQYFIASSCFLHQDQVCSGGTPTLIPVLISSGTPSRIIFIYCYVLTMVDYRLAIAWVVLFQVPLDAESKQRKAVCFLKFLALD